MEVKIWMEKRVADIVYDIETNNEKLAENQKHD